MVLLIQNYYFILIISFQFLYQIIVNLLNLIPFVLIHEYNHLIYFSFIIFIIFLKSLLLS